MKNMIQVAVLVLAASPAFAQTGTSAKGIYLDTGENRRPAMRFNVELYRDGEQTTVPTTFAFRDGDRMRFRFELNRDCYVYVLHRTVSGDAGFVEHYSGTRGIEVIRDEDQRTRRGDSYRLLFPTAQTGEGNLIRAHVATVIPAEPVYFRMDKQSGMEKLLILVAPRTLEVTKYFDIRTGRMYEDSGRNIPVDSVIIQLTKSLMDYSGNAVVEKGIYTEADYAAAQDGSKAIVVPVDLRHLPNR